MPETDIIWSFVFPQSRFEVTRNLFPNKTLASSCRKAFSQTLEACRKESIKHQTHFLSWKGSPLFYPTSYCCFILSLPHTHYNCS